MKGKNEPKPLLCELCRRSSESLALDSHSSGHADAGVIWLVHSHFPKLTPSCLLRPSFGKGAHLYLRQHPGMAAEP